MNATCFQVVLTLEAPFLFKSGASLPLGLDAATVEDEHGKPLVPGTHVRGHLWHTLLEFSRHELIDASKIRDWFGAPSDPGTQDAPGRGRLDFDAYWRVDSSASMAGITRGTWMPMPSPGFGSQGRGDVVRYRVRIDDESGTADTGALQLIGQTHEAGAQVSFVGAIHAGFVSEAEADELERWLGKALAWIPAMGALKGIGFGRLESYRIERQMWQPDPLALQPETAAESARQLSFQLDRPYCFGRRALEDNRFETVPYIPGGALRGALFASCEQIAKSESVLAEDARRILESADHLHIRHGWASSGGKRIPAVIPQSALALDAGFVDASETEWSQPFVLKSGNFTCVPSFPIDWKGEYDEFVGSHGFVVPASWADVRTAIDPATGSAASGLLYSLDCCLPGDENGPHEFNSRITLTAPEPERVALWTSLSRVLPVALAKLGKTEARASALTWSSVVEEQVKEPTARVVLTLLSDAILTCASAGSPVVESAVLSEYRAYFDHVSGGALTLDDLFVDQKLVGGHYFRNRFWAKETGYRPRVLTLAGSVFVLTIHDADAAARVLSDWLSHGLPSAEPDNWRINPYIRANGSGEIRLGTGIRQTRPKPGQVVAVRVLPTQQEVTP